MTRSAYSIFETALGWCGIAWTEPDHPNAGPAVRFFQLPEVTREMTESRIARRSNAQKSAAPPATIAEIIDRACKHLRGEIRDFRDVAVDLHGTDSFAQQVYDLAREIPAGKTRTYSEIAKDFGAPGAARAVGQTQGRNPVPLIVPCRRVLAAGGKPGGFSAYGGISTKARMLAIEGAPLRLTKAPIGQLTLAGMGE